MRSLKYLLIFYTLCYLLFSQDTPVNLESESLSHNQIQLNWNVWDPSDSYFDAIIYISDIQDINNQTIIMNFYIENSVQFSQFELSILSDIYLSNFNISSGLTQNFGWSVEAINNEFGNFSIIGNNNGSVIPSTSGIFFQLTANYDFDQSDETSFRLNYDESIFTNSFTNQLAIRWKNVIWEVGSGLADDECGDNICTVNENYSICPDECELDINYKVSRIDPTLLFTEVSENNLLVDNSFEGINMYPLNEYCFQVEAIDNNSGVTETSNNSCSTTLCSEINYCQDLDGDGLGNSDMVIPSCFPIENYVDNCDDENDLVYCVSNNFGACGLCNGQNYCTNENGDDLPVNEDGLCICPDNYPICFTPHTDPGSNFDCNGQCFGSAEKDDCGVCSGGITTINYNETLDCNNTCGPNDPYSLDNCDGILGYNPYQPSGDNCFDYLGPNGGVDECGICGGNFSACFPYFDGPTNLVAQASNLQIGLNWDPVNLCNPYIYDCDMNLDNDVFHTSSNNNTIRENINNLDAKISIDQIEDDGQGTVSFYLSLQADVDIYFARINLDIYDIYDTLSVFQEFPNLNDLSENEDDCFGGNQNCIQFGQPSIGVLDDDDLDFSAYTETNGSATLQSFSGDYIDSEILQEGTTLFKMDATYDPESLVGKELYVTHTLTIQSESDSLYVLKNSLTNNTIYEKANVRFDTSVWQVGFGLASIFSCGDGICQEPFEESGSDENSPSLDTNEDSEYFGQIVPDGYPFTCSTGLTEIFLGSSYQGDCIPEQNCGDGICQDENYCQLVNGVLQCGYTDGAPHPQQFENWTWCSDDCLSCGNEVCDWSNFENYCDNNSNDIPNCSTNPIEYLPCSADVEQDGIYGDCMEPYDVEYTVYRDNSSFLTEENCISNNGIWEAQCFTPLVITTNTQYSDVGLDYQEEHCYFIMASQGKLTTMNGMLDPDNGNINGNINGNSRIECDETNPQIGELPVIREINDVPGDQGGYVKLKVQRSYSDNGTVDSLYQVFRNFQSDTWDYVGSFPGTGEDSYYFISPTLANFIPNNPNYHYFKVYYRGYLDSSAFSNFPEYGYSTDDIEPLTPSGLTTRIAINEEGFATDEIILEWNPNLENDFSHYVIYRNGSQIDLSNTHSFIDHNYTIPGGFNFGQLLQYQIGAYDVHGNQSELSPVQITSYGNIGNVSFQDIYLNGQGNLNGTIDDSSLVDILDLTMAQSIACNQSFSCTDDFLLNPTEYELWASNLNFDGIIDVQDLGCLVYFIQNDIICPSNNVSIIQDYIFDENSIIFNVDEIYSFEINLNHETKIINHNLTQDWKFINYSDKIVAYSLFNTKFTGQIKLEFHNPKIINSIHTNSYK